jgi:hypothetical protein
MLCQLSIRMTAQGKLRTFHTGPNPSQGVKPWLELIPIIPKNVRYHHALRRLRSGATICCVFGASAVPLAFPPTNGWRTGNDPRP